MTFSIASFRRITTPIAMACLGLILACGTEAATSSDVEVTLPTTEVSAVVSSIEPGEVEHIVAESMVSVTPRRLGVGELFRSAPSDYYDAYDWDTAPTTERPAFLDGVVQHRMLSPDVGIRGLSITTVAPRGGGRKSTGFASAWLWSEDPDATPIGATQPFPLNHVDEVSLDVGQDFVPYLLFETHSEFEGTVLATAIVDYEQVEFEMDGTSGLLHEFKTLPGRMLAIPINFGSFSPGAHDIELMVFEDPYRGYGHDDLAEEIFNPLGFQILQTHALDKRVRLVVGDDETPARAFSIDAIGSSPPPNFKAGPTMFSRTGASTPIGRENHLRVGDGTVGEEFDFTTWSGRWDTAGDGTQALMLFMDYKMIPFNGDTVYFTDLAAGEMTIFDSTITLPDEPGDHQMIWMAMYDPYRSMVDARFMEFESSHEKLVINAR